MDLVELNIDLITLLERLVAGTASQRADAWVKLTSGDTFWCCCRLAVQAGKSETLLEALESASRLVEAIPIEGDSLWLWEARCLALVRLLKAALIASLAIQGCAQERLANWLAWAAMDAPLPRHEAPLLPGREDPEAAINAAWRELARQGCDRELAAIRDAAVVLLGEKATAQRVATPAIRAPLLLTVGDTGRLGWLWAERVAAGNGDLLRASSTWLDPIAPSALVAIEDAWEVVQADTPIGSASDVRWWLSRISPPREVAERPVRAYEIHGRSLQAAAAALFFCLSCDQPYDDSVAVSAELDADGKLGGVAGFGEDAPKLRAALELARERQGATVVVAEGNHPSPSTVADWQRVGVQLQVARDLQELKRLVAAPTEPSSTGGNGVPSEEDWLPNSGPVRREKPRARWRGLVVGAAFLGSIVVGGNYLTLRLDQATKMEKHAALLDYAHQIREAATALDQGDAARAESLLAQTAPSLREWAAGQLALRTRGAAAVLPLGEAVPVAAIRFCRDSQGFVSTGTQGYQRTWERGKSAEVWSEPLPRNAPFDFQAGSLSRFGERSAHVLVPRPRLMPQAPWTVIIRDRKTGEVWREAGAVSRVDALALDSAGQAVAAATYSKTQGNGLVLFAQRHGRWERSTHSLPFRCRALAYSPDGATLALAGDRGVVQLLRQGSLTRLWVGPCLVKAMEFSPDGRTLAVGSRSGQYGAIQLLSLTGKPVRRVAEMQGDIVGISYDRRGSRATVTTDHGDAAVWECRSWSQAASIRTGGPTAISDLVAVLSPDGKSLALGDSQGRLETWELDRRFPQEMDFSADRGNLNNQFAPTLVVHGGSLTRDPYGQVHFRPAGSRTVARLSTIESGPMALSPDGKIAAVDAGKYVNVHLGRSGTWRTLAATGTVAALAFTPDSRNLAIGLVSGEVTVWDVRSWEQLLRLQPNPPLPRQQLSGLQFLRDQCLVGETSSGTRVTWHATK